jgi:hypothetical protein
MSKEIRLKNKELAQWLTKLEAAWNASGADRDWLAWAQVKYRIGGLGRQDQAELMVMLDERAKRIAQLEAQVERIRAEEREACAKVADREWRGYDTDGERIAAAIRARGAVQPDTQPEANNAQKG